MEGRQWKEANKHGWKKVRNIKGRKGTWKEDSGRKAGKKAGRKEVRKEGCKEGSKQQRRKQSLYFS